MRRILKTINLIILELWLDLGVGKTRILVHKLASLLLMEDVKHEQLLMVTFSRAAATEFKKRLISLIGNAAHYIEIKTFHSYCFDLLGRVGSLEKSDAILKNTIEKIKRIQIPACGHRRCGRRASFWPDPARHASLGRAMQLVSDPDLDVASNAVAAAALLAKTSSSSEPNAKPNAVAWLCKALGDFRSYVRANALAGLGLLEARCDKGAEERRLLAQDPSEIVRQQAARLLASREYIGHEQGRRACSLSLRGRRQERDGRGRVPRTVFVADRVFAESRLRGARREGITVALSCVFAGASRWDHSIGPCRSPGCGVRTRGAEG